MLKDEPDSASAYSNMGNVHLSQRRPEQAVADFSRAIQLAPEVGMRASPCNCTTFEERTSPSSRSAQRRSSLNYQAQPMCF